MSTMSRRRYAEMFGPTTGDRIRLGDTSLLARIERDHGTYGEEGITGVGKSLRDGNGIDGAALLSGDALEVVIFNVVIMCPVQGIMKGDIGIRGGRIAAIGKAGNPAIMAGVTPGMIVGPGTKHFSGQGMIATPGGIDVHSHYGQPAELQHAMSSGLTTLIGGGYPGCWSIDSGGEWANAKMLKALDALPMNFGLFSRGGASRPEAIAEQISCGVIGVKIHEDLGAMPAVIDTCLSVADDLDFQVQLHTDGMNEAGFFESTMAAIAGRTIHMYHTEGAGGGHAPDIIRCNGEAHCLPSSTTPTNPFTLNAFEEHMDMMMLCHTLRGDIPEDVAFAESRLRPQSMAAEDVLHDLGAISMAGSDAEGMGRVMDVIAGMWRLASKMKDERGALSGEPFDNADNARILRYLAKYTINPAIAFGISDHVGSLEVGKMADIVLWNPAFFGVKASQVIKGGAQVWSPLGDASGSLSLTEPTVYRESWPACGSAPDTLSAVFVHPSAIENDMAGRWNVSKPMLAIGGTRKLSKADMVRNDALPEIRVNPQTFEVFADGELATSEPVTRVALGRTYFLR
jgi:urease subunit alpha